MTKSRVCLQESEEGSNEFCIIDFGKGFQFTEHDNFESCVSVELDNDTKEKYLALQREYAKMQDHLYKLFHGSV